LSELKIIFCLVNLDYISKSDKNSWPGWGASAVKFIEIHGN